MVVDPGQAAPVNAALAERDLQLTAILITHHHFDHVGGVCELKQAHGCVVYGPANPAIADIDHTLHEGDSLAVGNYSFEVLAVPGHTLDHIAYFQEGTAEEDVSPLLFCGDTLFAGGCGRIFEGDPTMMHASLRRLAILPGDTEVFCAHEYTLANLEFARAADPDNAALAERERLAIELRLYDKPTVPSTIALENATNPFLRAHEDSVQRSVNEASVVMDTTDAFAKLRAWKDNF